VNLTFNINDVGFPQNGYDNEKKEDEMIEEELLELSSSHPGLAMSLRASDAEMNQLHDKVAALEVELHGERLRHHDVLAKLEDLQQQIHRFVYLLVFIYLHYVS
jgi:chromosome segregation ATPase